MNPPSAELKNQHSEDRSVRTGALRVIGGYDKLNTPAFRKAIETLEAEGHSFAIRPAWSGACLSELFAEATSLGCTRIGAVGGDGTLGAAAAALSQIDSAPALGLIPGGTANDFARAWYGGAAEIESALRVLAAGAPRAVDVGNVNGDPFVNMLSIGRGAEATATTSDVIKAVAGPLAYIASGILRPNLWQPFQVSVEATDTDEGFRGWAWMVFVGNGRFAGGGFEVCPSALPDDGLLDLTIVPAEGATALIGALASLGNGASDRMIHRQSAGYRIRTLEPVFATRDGEAFNADTFEVSLCARKLSLLA